MQSYELMLIYKPILFEDIKKNTITKIESILTQLEGKFSEVENFGKRVIAYKIKGFTEGHYVQYNLSLDASKVANFKKELNLLSDVLRFLIIKL